MSNELEVSKTSAPQYSNTALEFWLNVDTFDKMWKWAETFAATQMVPQAFQGKPADCMVAIEMASRCGVHPLAFMQQCYVIQGKPGIETKLAIAMVNASGVIRGKILYTFSGQGRDRTCTATCIDATDGSQITHSLSWDTVEKSGWANRDAWKKDPRMMIQYRTAIQLIRLYFPEVLLGCYLKDELEEMTLDAKPAKQATRLPGRLTQLLPEPAAEPEDSDENLDRGDAYEPDTLEAAAIEQQLADEEQA